MNYWLVKSEPSVYSWEQFLKDKSTIWDGVRNYAARNNLKMMKKGDEVCFYHSNEGMEVVGIAKVAKEYFPDPKAPEDEGWVAVILVPYKTLKKPVSLKVIKSDKKLQDIYLVKQGRLSVMPLNEAEYERIIELSGKEE